MGTHHMQGKSADILAPDTKRQIDRIWLAGVPVDALTADDVLALFSSVACSRNGTVLANVNLHALHEALGNAEMLDLMRAPDTRVHIDGMPIVWLCKILGAKVNRSMRNTHIDLIPPMLRACAANGWKTVIVGGDEAAARENQVAFENLFPKLDIACLPGVFSLDDQAPDSGHARTLAAVNALQPHLLLVGMGMPRQEQWIWRNRAALKAGLIMPVGGFADYMAGRTKTPPRLLGRLGLEWFYRLLYAPRRLAFRYLVEPTLLVVRLARATLKGARWSSGVAAGEGGSRHG